MKTEFMLMIIPQSAKHQFNADASVTAKQLQSALK